MQCPVGTNVVNDSFLTLQQPCLVEIFSFPPWQESPILRTSKPVWVSVRDSRRCTQHTGQAPILREHVRSCRNRIESQAPFLTASLATWLQRKHQRFVTAVLPERNGPVERASEPTQCCRPTTQRTTEENVTILFTGREICRMCCDDQLNPQPIPAARALACDLNSPLNLTDVDPTRIRLTSLRVLPNQ